MAALDNLPPDQRAVLQMVLQRGRSYDEIAAVLSIERGAVRQRALDAFDALTPATVLPGPERALVTDYLLGQLPERVAEQVHSYLRAAEADREWALALAQVVAPLVSGSLPEIPAGAPLGAGDLSAGGPEADGNSAPGDDAAALEPASGAPRSAEPESAEPVTAAHASIEPLPAAPATARREPRRPGEPVARREPGPSSRRGGAILLGVVAALIVAAVIIAIAGSGGSGGGTHTVSQQRTSSTHTGTVTTTRTSTTSTTHILAQVNLSSPTGAKATLGIAEVVREKGVVGVVIDAQGVPPNTAHNAYAVWLYNSPTSHQFVGFVPTLVGTDGKLVTEGKLPADASSYHRLLITLETQSKPSSPGEVVLSGTFREHP